MHDSLNFMLNEFIILSDYFFDVFLTGLAKKNSNGITRTHVNCKYKCY